MRPKTEETTVHQSPRASASLVGRAADRVISIATERLCRTAAIESAWQQRAARSLARWAAWTAHTVKLLPEVEVVRLADARWTVTFIGDPYMRWELQHTAFLHEVSATALGQVRLWALPAAVERGLDTADLVVCSLPQGFPSIWRPSAPITFRTPPWVDHLWDLTVPLPHLLAGTRREEARQLVAQARRLPISTRLVRDEGDIRRFHELLVAFQRRRHGTRAMVSSYRSLANRLRRPDYELIDLVHAGEAVGGVVVRFVGPEATSLEAAWVEHLPPELMRSLPTRAFLVAIERALERGCKRFRFGGSRALLTDPVFRAKRRWGARTIPRDNRLQYPEWTWLARDLPPPLAEHLNRVGLITFHGGRSCVVRIEAGEPASTAPRRLDGVEGRLVVWPGESRFEPFAST